MRNIKSTISHCSDSSRVYLMDLHHDDFPKIISIIENMADENGYTKLFAKIPATYGPAFLNAGYVMEALIPGFYNGSEDALFMMKYKTEERAKPESEALEAFQQLLLKPANTKEIPMDADYTLKPLKEADATNMVPVFKEVFETYPFPIYDPDYLIKTMKEDDTRYFGAFFNNELIAISSAECNNTKKNAEMTDFAVISSHRGKRLAVHLLKFMEEELVKDGFKTFYTIARLHSLPMNKTFYNLGYKYSGTLHNNTQISGKIESMNIWYKSR
ncbi:putative beta-lysine N-acetyltransferase [Alkalitalea saponilacus]|uniref:Putative beta-lysine N-acetyltransferase n=1 Tax=Alkalitalea saponilacus TaxID=889453 RepID=A0A1T5HTA7_9BACT|nr:putative beta-lysine N-acetyltransferase [Alkalitalea saponilacus]ASB50190.1 putative beta-lysine N-acetyltransferase [Alkalitalea saponilacus]SKC23959.1 putative beta-lysine N-acetyltransferase [Alkalitalea saponilacus]